MPYRIKVVHAADRHDKRARSWYVARDAAPSPFHNEKYAEVWPTKSAAQWARFKLPRRFEHYYFSIEKIADD